MKYNMSGLAKQVVNGNLIFLYKNQNISAEKYYKLRYELSKK